MSIEPAISPIMLDVVVLLMVSSYLQSSYELVVLVVLVVNGPWAVGLRHAYPAEVHGARDGYGGEDGQWRVLSVRFPDVNDELTGGFPKLGELLLRFQKVVVRSVDRQLPDG